MASARLLSRPDWPCDKLMLRLFLDGAEDADDDAEAAEQRSLSAKDLITIKMSMASL